MHKNYLDVKTDSTFERFDAKDFFVSSFNVNNNANSIESKDILSPAMSCTNITLNDLKQKAKISQIINDPLFCKNVSGSTLNNLLDELNKIWIDGNIYSDMTTLCKICNIDTEELKDPTGNYLSIANKISKAKEISMVQIKCLWYMFRVRELVGHNTEIANVNQQKFKRLFELVSESFNAIETLVRLRQIASNNYNASAVIKSPDYSIYRFSFMDSQKATAFQVLILYLLAEAFKCGYRKKGDKLYSVIITPEGKKTTAWRIVSDIKAWINSLINKETNANLYLKFTSKTSMTKDLEKHIIDHPEFELDSYVPNRAIHAYRDGQLNICDMSWLPWGDQKIDMDTIACQYHNYNLNFDTLFSIPKDVKSADWWYDEIKTPLFQGILNEQLIGISEEERISFRTRKSERKREFEKVRDDRKSLKEFEKKDEQLRETGYYGVADRTVSKIIYAMIGRLLFEVNAIDKWGIAPFFKGLPQTGKSTIIWIIYDMFMPEDAGILSANQQITFGWETLSDKLIIVCPEVTQKFNIAQTDLQTVITGESLVINRKGIKSLTIPEWKTPLVFAGNQTMNIKDLGGNLGRRLPVIEMNEKVSRVIADLRAEHRRTEQGPFMVKCLYAYHWFLTVVGNDGIWDHLPKYFIETRRNLAEETTSIVQFINNGVADGIILLGDQYKYPEELVRDSYRMFCLNRNIKAMTWSKDTYDYVFTERGLSIRRGDYQEHRSSNGTIKEYSKWIHGLYIVESDKSVGNVNANDGKTKDLSDKLANLSMHNNK